MPRREIPATYGTPTPGVTVGRRDRSPARPPSGDGPIVVRAEGLGGYFASARLVRLTAWGATVAEALAALKCAMVQFPKGLVRVTPPEERCAQPKRFAPERSERSARQVHRSVGIAFGRHLS